MWRHVSFFALLYFIQGAAFAYIVNFQKPFLAENGVSKQTLGLFTSLLLIPFIAKVFLGMLSDRLPWGRWGARKPYMVLGLAGFALCYATLSRVSPATDFPLFAGLTWLASLGLALFDTCADGWAIDVAGTSEQSVIQAAMISGKSLGLILMSWGFGFLAQMGGFQTIFMALAILSMVVLGVVMITPHTGRVEPCAAPLSEWRDLLRSSYLYFAGFGIVYSIASFGTDGLLTLYLADARLANVYELGVFGVARGLGAFLGAILFVRVMGRGELNRSLFISVAVLGVGCLSPLLNPPLLSLGVFWGACWGFQETAYVTAAMRFSQGSWAAS
ncbi:MAG: MFS transporter, partial [Bdellovibrionales bacterium]